MTENPSWDSQITIDASFRHKSGQIRAHNTYSSNPTANPAKQHSANRTDACVWDYLRHRTTSLRLTFFSAISA